MIHFRKVTAVDSHLLLSWRNDPASIAQSLTSTSVTLEEHTKWFEKKLADPTSLLLIGEIEAKPCGHIRFDKVDDAFLISFVVAPEFRGQGLAVQIITGGIAHCMGFHPEIRNFKAQVKISNIPSLKAFQRAGFQEELTINEVVFFEISYS